MGKISIFPGDKFNRLTVVRRVTDKVKGVPRFECRCTCGRTIVSTTGRLRSNNTKSCGCLFIEHGKRWAPQMSKNFWAKDRFTSAANRIFREYLGAAKSRGLPFELTLEDIRKMIVSPCWYCGSPPSREVKSTRLLGLYSGIDRKDNDRGYSSDNCVPCCKQCNRAKNKFSTADFLSWAYLAGRYMGA